jgi:hypothetical protein
VHVSYKFFPASGRIIVDPRYAMIASSSHEMGEKMDTWFLASLKTDIGTLILALVMWSLNCW